MIIINLIFLRMKELHHPGVNACGMMDRHQSGAVPPFMISLYCESVSAIKKPFIVTEKRSPIQHLIQSRSLYI